MVKSIGEIIGDKNIKFDAAFDPVSRGGFTQIPNFILKAQDLSIGAKIAYAMFLSYAWQNDSCFPGQERLGEDMGMSRSRVSEFIGELENTGFISIRRRGQGKTNIYTIHFQVTKKQIRRRVPSRIQMSAGRHLDVDRSAS